jgi:ABC-type branched-subunit amino acid transport system substrate-binding protein
VESHHDLIPLFEHDLFGKPVSTFPDHALAIAHGLPDAGRSSNGIVIVIPGEGTMRKATRVLPVAMSLVAGMFYLSNSTMAEPTLTGNAPGNEIRIGTIMPYTGPLAAFSSIGRAEAAYFEMINERGGINGRKVRLIAYDDSSDPAAAIEHARKLVEKDEVLLVFGAFGTPSNLAERT